MNLTLVSLFCIIAHSLLITDATAQEYKVQGVYPSSWWVGMKDPKLQLMIRGTNVQENRVSISYPGVKMTRVSKPSNRNYLFVDLTILPAARPGTVKIRLSNSNGSQEIPFELKSRRKGNGTLYAQGIRQKDFLYLIMPDRFSNGDPSNDVIAGYRDQTSDRNNRFSRHGGDLAGIINHLDYLKELGVTGIWLTPIIENDVALKHEWGNSVAGYHGYWFTDHYEVDKRLGGNAGYLDYCARLHREGFKVVQDAIYNHISKDHWLFTDPPEPDWINNWPVHTGPNHREETLFDPYASEFDKKQMLDGWFTDHLPDLNQRNPFCSRFLIQHAIWSTEYFGVDAWRVDTYKYCDEAFLNRLNEAMFREFPAITIFGEAWVNSVVGNAYFAKNRIATKFRHNANGVLDFQSCFALLSAMNLSQGWTEGANKLYMTLAQDIVYGDPTRNVIFLDNHDMDRAFSVVGEDWNKMKMGLNWLLTLRGIPQLYYGTEVLMKNMKVNTDATVREDFPGGWPDDKEKDNRFTRKGRSDRQNEAFDHVSRLARFRQSSSAITSGKLMQYVPKDGLYVYFRYDDRQTVMVIANTTDKKIKPDWSRYSERLKGFSTVRNVVSGKIKLLSELELDAKDSFVFELLK
ncbi:MAG TPA: alpha-amylase family glycosyl hydrolase [Chitinophagaceae bacterium]|nr:alpha-amylase family glycosyl hydrolase [Chitinophagaceae bacterium]